MTVKTTRIGARTTVRLTLPLADDPAARGLGAALLIIIVLLATFAGVQVPAPAAQEAQPQIVRDRVIYIVATPTAAPLPTPAPIIAPPTLAPEPTPEPTPEIVYQPVYIEVQAAPVVEPLAAPVEVEVEPTPIPGWVIREPAQPVEGGCILTRGGGICQLAKP